MSIKNVIKDALGIAPILEDRSNGFRAAIKSVEEIEGKMLEEAVKNADKIVEQSTPSEEWVWVSGYKATDKDMCCRDYQYELNKQVDVEEGAKVEDCIGGFHFCLKLEHVFNYYGVGKGHRFFEVSALVRKSDLEEYGKRPKYKGDPSSPFYYSEKTMWGMCHQRRDKLAAKSIIFLRELTPEEIFEHVNHKNFTREEMQLALSATIGDVYEKRNRDELISLGFSELVAIWLVDNGKEDIAKTIMSQEGMSMDAKMLIIFSNDD